MDHEGAVPITDTMGAFRAWLIRQGLGDGTVHAYCADVRLFLQAVVAGGDQLRMERLSADAAMDYIFTVFESAQITAITARRKVTALRRLFQFLQEAGYCDIGADLHALRLRDAYALRTRLDIRKARVVVEAPDPYRRQGMRDRALLGVLYETGMQVKELCALRVSDWDVDRGQLSVGQEKRLRRVSLGAEASYVKGHVDALGDVDPSTPLLPSRSGGHLTPRDVTRIVRKYVGEVGLREGDVTPQAIIAVARMRMINVWPDRAKDELGYSQLCVAKRRYVNLRLAAQATTTDDEQERRVPGEDDLNATIEQAFAEMGLEAGSESLLDDARWLARAFRCGMSAARHGFPPSPPLGVLSRYRSLLPDGEPEFAARLSAVGHALRPLLDLVEKRRRNRRGQEPMPDPVRVAALRQHFIASHHALAAMARIADHDMESGARDPGVLGLLERLLDPDATEPEVEQRARKELARQDRAHQDHTDAVIEGRDPRKFPRHLPLAAGFQDLLLSSPFTSLDTLERMLTGGAGWEAFAWLADELWPGMRHAYCCAIEYYRVPTPESWNDASVGAIFVSMVTSLIRTSPKALQRAGMGVALDHLILPCFEQAFVESLALNLAHAHDLPPLWNPIEQSGGVRQFVRAFEKEWEQVLLHTDGRFGFAVVPRLSVPAACLYLRRVPWEATGKRCAMRREVADYLVHRALATGEAVRAQLPRHWGERAFAVLAPSMEPLVQSRARKIVRADQDLQVQAAAADLRRELRDLINEYDPHRRFRDTPGQVARGAVGAARRGDVAKAVAALGVSPEDRPLPLVSYLEKKLKEYARREIRRMLEIQDSGQLPTVIGPRGEEYVTVYGAAKLLGCSIHQARRLDHPLAPRRLRDVWPRGVPKRYRHMPGASRLYPLDGTLWQEGEQELRSRVNRTSAIPEGYATRASVAKALGVHASALVRWEQRGQICPARRGRNVLYSSSDIEKTRDFYRSRK